MPLSRIAAVTLTILLFEHCTTVTLTRFTQQRTDMPRANPTVVVLLTEMLKLVLALWLECTESFGMGSSSSISNIIDVVRSAPIDTLKVSVPAFLYTIQNISIFVALGNLEVVTFQVLYQTKLMLTAILSVLFLGRRLTTRQWASLITLTTGVIAVELSDATLKSAATGRKSDGRRLDAQVLPGAPHQLRNQPHQPHLVSPQLAQPAQPQLFQQRPGCAQSAPALHAATLAPSGEPLANLWSVSDALRAAEAAESQVLSLGAAGCAHAAAAAKPGHDTFIRTVSAVEKTIDGSRQGPYKWPHGGRRMTANDHTGRELSDTAQSRQLRSLESRERKKSAKKGKGGAKEEAARSKESEEEEHPLPAKNPLYGLVAALLAATLSSFAGVYFEALVKGKEKKPPSLWMRNVQLCLFTIPLASLAVVGQNENIHENGALNGIDAPTSLLILLNASGGLLVAAVIKYGDNILKNFTTSCSVILGTLISVVLFDFKLSLQFGWGSTLVVCSAYAYATAPPPEDESYKSIVATGQGSRDASTDEADDAESGALTPIKA